MSLRWVALDVDGVVIARAATQAELAIPTGGQVIQATHPVGLGYTYNATTRTFTARAVADEYEHLLADLPHVVRRRVAEVDAATFSVISKAHLQVYLKHLTATVNALLLPANRDQESKVEMLTTELEWNASNWLLTTYGSTSRWRKSVVATYERTQTNGTPLATPAIVVSPATYASIQDLLRWVNDR